MVADPWGLALEHRRVAVWAARRYRGLGLDDDDLIQEAYLGLHRAALTFDPAICPLFEVYGRHWACRAIRKALVRGGRWVHSQARPARGDLRRQRDVPPGPGPGVVPETAAPPPAECPNDEERWRIRMAIGRLDDRSRAVIWGRFFDEPPRGRHEIASELGCHFTHVTRLQHEAFRKLAAVLHA